MVVSRANIIDDTKYSKTQYHNVCYIFLQQERIPPLVDDFLYICDGAYTLSQLLKMEMNILRVVDFDLGIPLSYRFLRRYARVKTVFNTVTR